MKKEEIIKNVKDLIRQRDELNDKIAAQKDLFLENFSPVQVGDRVRGKQMYEFESQVTKVTIDNDLRESSIRIRFCRVKKDGSLGQEFSSTPIDWLTKVEA